MNEIHSQNQLLLSLQRALLGNVDSDLRQASVEADIVRKIVKIRFEHGRAISDDAKERLSVDASEVIADFPSP